MATNLHIDERLLAQAVKIGGLKTKRETVDEALREFVRRREQMRIVKLFGTIDYQEDYDHKAERRRDHGKRRKRGAA